MAIEAKHFIAASTYLLTDSNCGHAWMKKVLEICRVIFWCILGARFFSVEEMAFVIVQSFSSWWNLHNYLGEVQVPEGMWINQAMLILYTFIAPSSVMRFKDVSIWNIYYFCIIQKYIFLAMKNPHMSSTIAAFSNCCFWQSPHARGDFLATTFVQNNWLTHRHCSERKNEGWMYGWQLSRLW